jgi:FkbM family methyltransferase
MDSLDLVSPQNNEVFRIKINDDKRKKLLVKCILISLLFLFISNIYTIIFIFNLKSKVYNIDKNYGLSKILKNNQQSKNEIIAKGNINKLKEPLNNNDIFVEYIEHQKNFCNKPDKFYNPNYEKLIRLTRFSFGGISYQMYVYNKLDRWGSDYIIRTGKYEPRHMSNFLNILKYYGEKNNIKKNEDIFMLDIGGNLGVYPLFLGKFGYSIITFEASPRNSYILYKNYCLTSKNTNIIIVNKGLSNEEKTCNYYSQIKNIGNGAVLCDEKEKITNAGNLKLQKEFEVKLTKLSNFLPYFLNKNIALIKMDIEGGEGIVIKDAIQLISKYHVPFIFTEFEPKYLEKYGTNPKQFLELFIHNGYKISDKGFLNVTYITLENINLGNKNLYFTYYGKYGK